MRRQSSVAAALAAGATTSVALVLLMYGGQALAKKPVKPPPDPEPGAADVIYFEDVDAGLSSIPSDASEKPTSLAPPTGRISGSAHGGSRWVLFQSPEGSRPRVP